MSYNGYWIAYLALIWVGGISVTLKNDYVLNFPKNEKVSGCYLIIKEFLFEVEKIKLWCAKITWSVEIGKTYAMIMHYPWLKLYFKYLKFSFNEFVVQYLWDIHTDLKVWFKFWSKQD